MNSRSMEAKLLTKTIFNIGKRINVNDKFNKTKRIKTSYHNLQAECIHKWKASNFKIMM